MKWKDVQPNVTIGDVVLLKEDNLPSLPPVWKKAVISDIRAGRDGLTRDTKNSNGNS
jgi:hypothetical protein